MYTSFQLAKKYLHYYMAAFNGKGHGMHSPFVFDFIVNVLNNKNNYNPPAHIELLRKELLHDSKKIEIEDFGAGSRIKKNKKRTVQKIARTAVKPKKYSQLLYRLVKHYHPQNIIELGTSLGISTAYMAMANPAAQIVTIEGSSSINYLAQENFQKLAINNIKAVQGNFDIVLPDVLQNFPCIDLAYIDGNHRYQPTINYFLQILTKSNNYTIFIFDDIHWSYEMEAAWKHIQQHPSVTTTIDLFFIGIVLLRNEFKTKQHFTIRF